MIETALWVLSAIGVIVCVFLVRKILGQMSFLEQQKKKVSELEDEARARSERLKDSLRILCGSMIDDQVEISEGCMRVKILLDHYDATLHDHEVYGVFNIVYERLEKMPRFEERQSIDKRLLHKLDQRRYQVEAEFKDAVLEASKRLMADLA